MLEVTASVYEQQNEILAYLGLPQKNQRLVERILALEQQNNQLELQLKVYNNQLTLDSIKHPQRIDSLISAEKFRYIPCHAIRNSVDKSYNYIVIDKGRKHGIREGMGLVSPQGIAGKVVKVGENFSWALSALNVSFKLSAREENSGYTGVLEWEPGDIKHAYLDALPSDAEVQIKAERKKIESDSTLQNQRVLASGYSTVFPRDYLIGYIVNTDNLSQDGFYRVRVELATDFNRLYNLFAIDALHAAAIDSIGNTLQSNE